MENVITGPMDRASGHPIRAYVLIFAAATLALAWQFIFPGYYHMFALDAAMLPKYVAEFNESFRQGIFYPRWMGDDFWGYGSPMFVLYSPFLYIMSSAMNLSGLGLAHATAVIKLLSLFVGGVFLFHLLRKRHGDRAALIASLFYVLLPTRIYDIYYHNTPAGRFGEAFMPMTLFFVSEMGDGPMKRKDLAGFGLAKLAACRALDDLPSLITSLPSLDYQHNVQFARYLAYIKRIDLNTRAQPVPHGSE